MPNRELTREDIESIAVLKDTVPRMEGKIDKIFNLLDGPEGIVTCTALNQQEIKRHGEQIDEHDEQIDKQDEQIDRLESRKVKNVSVASGSGVAGGVLFWLVIYIKKWILGGS